VLNKVKHAADFGITTGPVSFDFAHMKTRKDNVLQSIRKSLEGLIQSNGITIFRGAAEFTSPERTESKRGA
jgi:dihydrolipoamide dehydrogenase